MPRYVFPVILGLAVLGFLYWQNEGVQDLSPDALNAQVAQEAEKEPENLQPLSPKDRQAYLTAVKRAFREEVVVYRGRLRISGGVFGHPFLGVEYVPIPLISVRCDGFFGVEIRGPGGEGETVSAPSMNLIGMFSGDEEQALQDVVKNASNTEEVLEEACRLVIDELDRLIEQPPS